MNKLPDVEKVAAVIHAEWMRDKRSRGIESRPDEQGREQMVPYDQLPEASKGQTRAMVQAVYDAIRASSD